MEVRVPAQHILKSLRENRMPDRILLTSGKTDQSVKTSLLEVKDPVTIEGYDSEKEDEEQEEEVAGAMDPANLTINQRWLGRLFPTARQIAVLRFPNSSGNVSNCHWSNSLFNLLGFGAQPFIAVRINERFCGGKTCRIL